MSGSVSNGPQLWHLTNSLGALDSILRMERIKAANPFGAVRRHELLADSQRVVCLSEILDEDREQLAGRHGFFGMAFSTVWARQHGAAPIWYLPRGTKVQAELFDLVKQLAYRQEPSPDHPLWKLTPFIDYPGEHPRPSGVSAYNWMWEREWRVVGDLSFGGSDVETLFAPEEHHAALGRLWDEIHDSDIDPMPPLVDLKWSLRRQKNAGSESRISTRAALSEWLQRPGQVISNGIDTAPGPLEWVSDEDLEAEERAEERAAWLEVFDRDDS